MSKQGVRFAAGTVGSPGEYRNVETGQVRYFDGNAAGAASVAGGRP